MEFDANRDAPAEVDTDVCIVGAGPVGLGLARSLDGHGCSVVVVESGRHVADPRLEALNAGELSGAHYQDLVATRHRGVGGTARLWNTAYRGGMVAKVVGLDPIDFETRPWIPWSGWPIPYEAIQPYLQPALDMLEGIPERLLEPSERRFHLPKSSELVERRYHFVRPDSVTRLIPSELRESSSARLLIGATVTHLLPGLSGGTVRGIRWRTIGGGFGIVRARRVVLAAGGIENARLLLAAEDLPGDVSRREGWLGRGFMEHPVDSSLSLTLAPEMRRRGVEVFLPREERSGHVTMPRLGLSDDLQRKERILNASIRLIPSRFPSRWPWLKHRRPWRRREVDESPDIRVLIDLEQAPQRENQITLSSRRDPLGSRHVSLDWAWRTGDERRREDVVAVVARELERAGLGRIRISTEQSLDANSHHHPGATRMSADPADGVVDGNLRVHQIDNLFVVGASVFPTAGFANPTLMAVALALRLGDLLAGVQRPELRDSP